MVHILTSYLFIGHHLFWDCSMQKRLPPRRPKWKHRCSNMFFSMKECSKIIMHTGSNCKCHIWGMVSPCHMVHICHMALGCHMVDINVFEDSTTGALLTYVCKFPMVRVLKLSLQSKSKHQSRFPLVFGCLYSKPTVLDCAIKTTTNVQFPGI